MYSEREQDNFGIGDALASLALILGGGAAGRKMVGRTAIPSKAELTSLYTTMTGKVPTKVDLKAFGDQIKSAVFGTPTRQQLNNRGVFTPEDITMDLAHLAPQREAIVEAPTTDAMAAWMAKQQGHPVNFMQTPSPFLASKNPYAPKGYVGQPVSTGDVSFGVQKSARSKRKPADTSGSLYSAKKVGRSDLFSEPF